MPIKSYIAHSVSGKKEELITALNNFSQCEVVPAENQDVLALVTDTPNETTEETLQESLKNLQSLQSLDLAFGYNESNDEN